MNCKTYSLFEGVSSNCRSVSTTILLNLYTNKEQTNKSSRYDRSLHVNRNIRNQYTVNVSNKIDSFQEKPERYIPSNEYVEFVTGLLLAQSAGAEEYTASTYAEG